MSNTKILEAFEMLEMPCKSVPYSTIEYLYHHEKSDKILQEILFRLKLVNAEENRMDSNFVNTTVLYMIVAENHLDESLIQPIIQLFTTPDKAGEMLFEQGAFLIGKLCEKYGDQAMTQTLEAILEMINSNSEFSYLYLFECLDLIKDDKYNAIILKILKKPESYWISALIASLTSSSFKGILPRLREIKSFYQDKKVESNKDPTEELNYAIHVMENDIKTSAINTHSRIRGDWKSFIKSWELDFMYRPQKLKKQKVGRNDPCICGSGKKYKKCCL